MPLYFEWHDKCYLGAAHGISGILLTLLQLPEELERAGSDAKELVRRTADHLLERRFRSGNLPSSIGSYKDRLIHWCHGAPGLIPLLLRMASVYGEPKYLQLAIETGEVVWCRGLLSTKGLGLCHGIPGNGYSLLAIYRATGDPRWLRRAQHFAAVAATRERELSGLADQPYSLFEGMGGAICFWADILQHLHDPSEAAREAVRFPCYEF